MGIARGPGETIYTMFTVRGTNSRSVMWGDIRVGPGGCHVTTIRPGSADDPTLDGRVRAGNCAAYSSLSTRRGVDG